MTSMRKQYHFRQSKNGFYAWDIDKLVEKTKDLSVFQINLDDIKELDENFWYAGPGDLATCRSIADHIKLVNETSLKYPIILSSEGRVMDGMHRVVKALLEGYETIKAVQFEIDPEPDYTDVQAYEMPY